MFCTLLVAISANTQTIYDATNLAQRDLNGTARFVGMGGAMSALGGDISTIGTNPAGIGIYRSNDVMTSFSYSLTGTESDYLGSKFETNKARWNFDNIGAVIATKIGNVTPLRYVNFGFNYHKTKSFYKNINVAGTLNGFSQTFQMAAQADGITPSMWEEYNNNPFVNEDIGWISALGYNTFLINPEITSDIITDYPLLDNNNIPIHDENGKPLYVNYDYYTSIAGINPYMRDFHSQERGGVDQYDFNMSFNINDRFYLGISMGIYDVNYDSYSFYDEDYGNGEGYFIESSNRISGTGLNAKFGTIIRPFQYSSLRIGLAIHTPTFYKLTYTTRANIQTDLITAEGERTTLSVDTRNFLNGRSMDRDFQLNTPWLFNISLGYTVDSSLALGLEYEYEDYSTMKFSYPDGEQMWETGEVNTHLKSVSTFRAGVEYKPIPSFAFRIGYNYITSPFREDALKTLPLNSINTNTDYMNRKSMNIITLGIGYKKRHFYTDLAYKYDIANADFYPFYNENMNAINMKNTQSKILLTLGFRL